MLDANIKNQLKSYLEKVVSPIEIVASVDVNAPGALGQKSSELLEMLKEIAELSDLITLKEDASDARKPSFSLNRVGSDMKVSFAGIPMGHEFSSRSEERRVGKEWRCRSAPCYY